MKINHLHLFVRDVPGAVKRFEHLFGLTCTSNASSEAIAFLSDDHGFSLVLQKGKDDATYPDGTHFGFLVEEPSMVHAFHERATALGEEVGEVVVNGRGTFCYGRFDGVLVEVSCPRAGTVG